MFREVTLLSTLYLLFCKGQQKNCMQYILNAIIIQFIIIINNSNDDDDDNNNILIII